MKEVNKLEVIAAEIKLLGTWFGFNIKNKDIFKKLR
jgi:hypothetical protein